VRLHSVYGHGAFSRHVAESKALILHAGAGSIIHAVRSGKIPIVMPRRMKYHEHVDDHQVAFAEVLAEKGFVIMIEEPADLENAIEKALSLSREQFVRKSEPKLVALVRKILEQYDSECAHK
jgi:UDP-N-acetylglucosamine transferase subunit ALG13